MAVTQRHVVITDREYELPTAKALTGCARSRRFAGKGVAVELVGTVAEEEACRSHHLRRAREYARSRARQHGIPAVSSNGLDATLPQVVHLLAGPAIDGMQHTEPHDEPTIPPNRKARAGSLPFGSGGEL